MSPLAAIAFAAFGAMLFLGAIKRHWAIVMILSYPAFEQLLASYSPLMATQSWIPNVAVGLCAILSLVFSFMNNERPLRGYFSVTSLLVLLLYVLAGFGVFYSMMPAAAQYFIKAGFPYYVLMLVILPALVTRTDVMNKAGMGVILVGTLVIGMIMVSPRTVFYGMRLFVDMSYTKGGDERGNPLAIGELGGLVVIFAALLVPKRTGLFLLLFRMGAVVMGLAMCFLASVRGQLIFSAFFSAALLPLAINIRNAKQFFVRGGIVGVALTAVFAVYKVFLSGSESASRFSVQSWEAGITGRFTFVSSMLSAYIERPGSYLHGLGTGSFNAIVAHDGEGYLYPHNLIIEILTHHGLIGFALLTLIFILVARSGLYLYRAAMRDEINRGSVAITLAVTAYVTMISMKQGSFLLYPLPFYMFLIVVRMHRLALLDQEELAYGSSLAWNEWDSEDAASSDDGYSDVPMGGAHPA